MYSPLLSGGTAVNVLEAYVTENRHYVEATSGMMSGKKGYIAARKGDSNTLKSIVITGRVDKTYGEKKAEQEAEKAAKEKAESKYTHDIDLEYLKDYMPGGAKSLDGKAITASYTKKPVGWEFHLRPESLKLVGKKMVENEWANVYKVEDYAYTLYSWSGSQETTATIFKLR